MKIIRAMLMVALLIGFLLACAPSSSLVHSAAPIQVELPDQGPAPELNNRVWLNTASPLRLAELRGRVVLLDMWTFG